MSWGNRIVGVLGVGTFFSWLIGNLVKNSGALTQVDSYLWQSWVILYFTSWVAGVTLDKDNQEKVYVGAPEQLRVNYVSVISAFTIYGLFALMFFAVGYAIATSAAQQPFPLSLVSGIQPKHGLMAFVVFLNLLWLVNVPIWRHYVQRYISPIEHRSQAIYRSDHDYIGLLKVRIIGNYIKGTWQWYRFAVGGALLVACDAVIWQWRATDNVNLVVCLSIGTFLIVVEGWVWSMRLKVDHSLDCIDEIARHYQLMPHRSHTPGRAQTRAKRPPPS